MKRDSYNPGEVCWIDCGTDMAKGPAFYAKLFGWTLEDLGESAGGYQMASKDGSYVAGFGPQQNPGPPTWSVYFRTDDAVKTSELVTAHRGKTLVATTEAMEAGQFAVFTDPVGAAFSIWQPKQHPGFGIVDEPGAFCWAELVTTDADRSRTFYTDVFGFTTKESADPIAYTEFQVGEKSIGGMMAKPAEMPAEIPPMWGIYIAVADTDKTIAKVGQLGGTTVFGPEDLPPGRLASCVDPAGAMFSVIALTQT